MGSQEENASTICSHPKQPADTQDDSLEYQGLVKALLFPDPGTVTEAKYAFSAHLLLQF